MPIDENKLTPAPEAKRCEAGTDKLHPEGSCGAGQPLYATSGLNHCFAHAEWPLSKEGKRAAAIKQADKENP